MFDRTNEVCMNIMPRLEKEKKRERLIPEHFFLCVFLSLPASKEVTQAAKSNEWRRSGLRYSAEAHRRLRQEASDL